MQILVCKEPGKLAYGEAREPAPKKDHSIIKIKRVGICGTDLHAFEGTQPFFDYPRILGHELSGELVSSDGAPEFSIGDRVSVIPYFNCNHCIACRNGKPNCCVNINVCGVHIDGGMQEYFSVPSSSLISGKDLDYDALALLEPFAIGVHGVRRAGVAEGEFVLIVGAGPIGLGTMEFARIAGAKVIAMDINARRLSFAKEKVKVDYCINPTVDNANELLKEITGGDMPTVVIDATGSENVINNSFQYMSHGGRYVLIGLQKGEINFSHPAFHKREGTLMSSRNATLYDFMHVMDSIRKKYIDPSAYITHKVSFNEAIIEFPKWLDQSYEVIKGMIVMA